EPAPDETPAADAGQGSKLLVAAGVVTVVGALVLVTSMFPPFLGTSPLREHSPNTWQNGIEAVAAALAGICLLAPPSRRLIGPGFLFGAIATAPSGAVYDIIVGHAFPPAGPGLWLNVAACAILTVADVLAWRALAHHGAVRLGRRMPAGVLPWLVAFAGCAGAVLLVAQVLNQDAIAGTTYKAAGTDLFALYCTATMALVIPVVAVLASPRTFGVALLAGWITTAIAEAEFYSGLTSSVFALTLLVLLVLTVAYARTSRPRTPVATDVAGATPRA
ncbi:MAG TPA: hypothetical protein VFW16_08725, partial [Streptosporangiaceae bacterium]|nr:hypothetical protein [Streptosporangiaceae bacterium]